MTGKDRIWVNPNNGGFDFSCTECFPDGYNASGDTFSYKPCPKCFIRDASFTAENMYEELISKLSMLTERNRNDLEKEVANHYQGESVWKKTHHLIYLIRRATEVKK
jgi:hypothetical protein